jgi:hypothetical protein
MLNCPHCNKEIDDKLINKEMSMRGNNAQKRKYGKKLSQEMSRRVKVRWENHVSGRK